MERNMERLLSNMERTRNAFCHDSFCFFKMEHTWNTKWNKVYKMERTWKVARNEFSKIERKWNVKRSHFSNMERKMECNTERFNPKWNLTLNNMSKIET